MREFKTDHILAIILNRHKQLIYIGIIAVLVSSVFSSSWFIKPKYKSTAAVFPTNISPFSQESNTEQLLQYFNSEEIKTKLIQKFKLYDYYKIDTTEPLFKTYFNEIYKENIKISSTLYESVEIDVTDHSPFMAQKITQGIIDETNNLIGELKRIKLQEYVSSTGKDIKLKRKEIDSIEVRMKELRTKYNLVDFNAQAKVFSKSLGKSVPEEKSLSFKGLKEFGGEYVILQNQLYSELAIYNDLKRNYDKNLSDYRSDLSYTTVVSAPTLPDKKCYPVRWLIVLVTTLSSLLLSCIVFVFVDKKELA